jgi:hypothetical protein
MAELNLEAVLRNLLVVANVAAGQERIGSGLAAPATEPALLPPGGFRLHQSPANGQPPADMYLTDKVGFMSPRAGRSVRRSGSPARIIWVSISRADSPNRTAGDTAPDSGTHPGRCRTITALHTTATTRWWGKRGELCGSSAPVGASAGWRREAVG